MKNLYKYRLNLETGSITFTKKKDVTVYQKNLIVSRKRRNYEINYSNDYYKELNTIIPINSIYNMTIGFRVITFNEHYNVENLKTVAIQTLNKQIKELNNQITIKQNIKFLIKNS